MKRATARKYNKRLMVWGLILTLAVGMVNAPVKSAEKEKKTIAVDPSNSDEGYSAVLYDNTNGLPTSEANAIAETSEGFIWIGSYSGLIRYDGTNFERMDSTGGITSVTSLTVDHKDRLWIGTNDSGVAVMDKGNIQVFNKKDGLRSSTVRATVEDENENMYVATTQGVVMFDKNMKVLPVKSKVINEEYVRDLRLGSDGYVYGITMTDKIFTMKDGRVVDDCDMVEAGIGNVICIFPDKEKPGYLYVGTSMSEIYYGRWEGGLKDVKRMGVAPLRYIKEICVLDSKVFVCADNGIATVEDGKVVLFSNMPMTNSVDHVMVDYEGNLWFTSSRQGVMKVVKNRFVDINEKYHLPQAVVNTTCKVGERLYIGSDDGLYVVQGKERLKKLPINRVTTASGKELKGKQDLIAMLNGIRIRSIIRDSKKRLWFSTYGEYGLLRYDAGEVLCFNEEDGMPSERVRTVYERQNHTILVACTGGLVEIEGDKIKRIYREKDGLNNTEVLSVIEAKNKDILIGTDGDGIYVIGKKGLRHLTIEEGLNSDVIMRIKKDKKRDLFWIMTSNSIAYMTSDYQITTVKYFPYSNNFDLYENSHEEMWILSSNGIYVCDVDEMIRNEAIKPVFYGRDNGLPCITTANSYSEKTENGELYIAGSTGVARVNIEKDFEDVANVKMAVPFVDADGRRIYADEKGVIIIPASVTKVTIYGFVYTYSLLNPQITYYLDGFEAKNNVVTRHELKPVDYTNLKGGKYKFVMKMNNSMGRGNKELVVNIVKKKKISETVLFEIFRWGIMFLCVALLVQLYFHRKTKALYKKQQENRIFVREMTEAFARTVDMKDRYTNGHSTRVAEYTELLAKELGCDEETIEKYYYIALLHDIGKIAVPSTVLNKNGKLTDEEFAIIKSHSAKGYQALKDISIMPELAIGAGAHHERPDGKGYPKGLKGEEIPRVAQIIAVADTFDAMYSDRPYRKRMNFEKAVSIIKDAAGTQLAPDVVEAFLKLVDRGAFRDPEDVGGGTMEDIDNIHKKLQET